MELGVQRGWFSKAILNLAKPSKLYLVDLWKQQPGDVYSDSANIPDDAQEQYYASTLELLKSEISNGIVQVIRASTVEAMRNMPPDLVDYVYVDANHSYEATLTDLTEALRIISLTGIIMGHDYCHGNIHGHRWGVIQAIAFFLRKHPSLQLVCVTDDSPPTYLITAKRQADKINSLIRTPP